VTSLRPTSFSSNFSSYDVPSIQAEGVVKSPLGIGGPLENMGNMGNMGNLGIEGQKVGGPMGNLGIAPKVNWIDVRDIGR
jgi:hypothetical protein